MKSSDPHRDAAEALLAIIPVLIGVATRAVEETDPSVSLAQSRLLVALADLGPSASSAVAARLGTGASSVTRLADRLEASGHLRRRREPPNRSVVTLELTEQGGDLVARVLDHRRAALAALVADLGPEQARALAAALPILDGGTA